MLTTIVLSGLLGATIAVALWAWLEVRKLAIGWQDVHAHRRGRELPALGPLREQRSALTTIDHALLAREQRPHDFVRLLSPIATGDTG